MIEDGFKKLNKRLRSIIYDRYYLGKTQMKLLKKLAFLKPKFLVLRRVRSRLCLVKIDRFNAFLY